MTDGALGSWQLGPPGRMSYRIYDRLRARVSRRLADYLARHGLPEHGGRALEAGSGPASATSQLARRPGVQAVALDFDARALREGRTRDPALQAAAGDIFHLPFRDGTFDLVWSSSTLEHLSHRAGAVREMARVTRPGGRVFVGVPARWGPFAFQPLVRNHSAGIWIGPVFSPSELRSELRAAGLRPRHTLHYFSRCFVGVLADREGAES